MQQPKNSSQALGTFNTAEAVQEQIKVCTSHGLLREEQHYPVKSIVERLPVLPVPSSESEQVQQHTHERDEEQSIFITQQHTSSEVEKYKKTEYFHHSSSEGKWCVSASFKL